jgi:peptide/nickel transport system substrate-binding protein
VTKVRILPSGRAVLALLAALAVAVGCGAPGPGTEAGQSSLTILVPADGGQNYDPQTNASPSSTQFLMPVFDTLLGTTPDGATTPGLATAWVLSPDGTSLTLTLRGGVHFHDGSPFDADAVKRNLERGKTTQKSVVAGQLASITAIDAPNPSTVVLHLNGGGGALLGFLAGPAGMVASPASWARSNAATAPIGTGPWQVSPDSIPGNDMVYTRFAGYWDPSVARVDTIHIRVGAESTFVPGLSGGVAHAVLLTGSPTDGTTLSTNGLPVRTASTTYLHMFYLNKTGVFADPRVRRALSLAVDRQLLCDALLYGRCVPTAQPVPPKSWAYDTASAPTAPDAAAARELLAEAGHPGGIDVPVVVSSAGTQLLTELTALQQMVADAGIRISINARPVAQLLPALDDGTAQAYYTVNSGGADPAIPLAQMTAPAYNPGGYRDPAFDAALRAAGSALTPADRRTAYRRASAAYQATDFNVIVLNQDLQYATARGVTGIGARDPLTLDVRGATVPAEAVP